MLAPSALTTPQSVVGNSLLATLPNEEYERLRPHLESVRVTVEDPIYVQGDPVTYTYFPLDCIISNLAIMRDGATVEINMMGRESVVGIAAVIGGYKARQWTRGLVPGTALRVKTEVMSQLFERSVAAQTLLMGAYRAMVMQISQRSICNGRHTMLHRLSTWLLMVHDRVGVNEIPLTQETIAGRLGSRRASVTQAACTLHKLQAISYSRGKIHIDNRAAIEHQACECYEVHKKEFDSLEKKWGGGARVSSGMSLLIGTRLQDLL
ncbi:MAG TPA: Crp/Fnr family transcriptional regulator [Pyrinomonadaceae bacterium]|nr:Crp/Fnr family transcriptional regulator [Pyrinomonadaceae bacterium]